VTNQFEDSKLNDKILFVVAHPDDETIGAGGTIARFAKLGKSIFAISLTNGIGARGWGKNEALRRKEDSLQAASLLGFTWVYQGDFPDNSLDTVPFLDIVKIIESIKVEINPEMVFTHSSADLNIDHRIVAAAVLTAFRPTPDSKVSQILSMEIPSATDFGQGGFFGAFDPNYLIEITNTWQDKVGALLCYKHEIYPSPHARSLSGIEALSTLRGHQVGVDRAEAFNIVRKIERA